jgi:hypothetical protein
LVTLAHFTDRQVVSLLSVVAVILAGAQAANSGRRLARGALDGEPITNEFSTSDLSGADSTFQLRGGRYLGGYPFLGYGGLGYGGLGYGGIYPGLLGGGFNTLGLGYGGLGLGGIGGIGGIGGLGGLGGLYGGLGIGGLGLF